MVAKLLKFLQRELGGLHQAAFLLALSALSSQLLGLLRDRLLAHQFGAGRHLDVYYSAFRLPDLIYVTIASFISITVLIPLIATYLEKKQEDQLKDFFAQLVLVFSLVMVVVSGLAFVLLPRLAPLLAPGFSAEALLSLVSLSRILLLSPLLLGLSNLFGSITQTYRQFIIFSFAPLVYNLGIIGGIIFFYPWCGLPGLAYGVVVGAGGHLLFQSWPAFSRGYRPRLVKKMSWPEISRVVLVSLPRTITLSAHQFSLMVLVAIASLLPAGAIAIFNFSLNLQSVPLAIIGISYATAAFPVMAQLYARGETEKFLKQLSVAIRHIIFWSLPAMVLFIVLRAQLVRVILGSGQFDWLATRLVAASLAIFVLSVPAQSLVQLLVRAFYTIGETKIPLIVNTVCSLMIIGLAVLGRQLVQTSSLGFNFLAELLRVGDLPNINIYLLILPLAYSLGLLLNALILWCFLVWRFKISFSFLLGRSLVEALAASLLGGFATYLTLSLLSRLFFLDSSFKVFTQGLVAGVVGLAVCAGVFASLDNQEWRQTIKILNRKLFRSRSLMPETEDLQLGL